MGKRISSDEATLLMVQNGLEPLEEFQKGAKKWKCKCTVCGNIVHPSYANVRNGHSGCAFCTGKKVNPEDAEIFMKSKALLPLEPFKSSKSKWRCLCATCKEEVSPRYGDIKAGQGGCLKCGYKKAADQNRLDEQRALQVMIDAGLQPLSKYISYDKKWKSLCLTCGDICYPTFHSISSGQGGCKRCGTESRAQKNTNLEEDVVRVMLNAGYKPMEPYVRADSKWKCLHLKCNSIVYARYSQVNFGGGGCRKCGYVISANKNRISEANAMRIMIDSGLQPIESYVSAITKWKCIHLKCGRVVHPQLYKIQQGQGGCKHCGLGGLDLNLPAFLYVMTHKDFQSIKVGVGNPSSNKNRILEHTKQGWKLFRRIDFETGEIAYSVEQEVLSWIRSVKKLSFHLVPELMPQGGWTETVDASEIDPQTIWAKVEELSKVKR